MKWLNQHRKVEMLSLKASELSAQSNLLQHQIHDKAIAQLKKPETLIWAFAAGVFWVSTAPESRMGKARSMVKWVNTANLVLKLFGIPVPVRPPL